MNRRGLAKAAILGVGLAMLFPGIQANALAAQPAEPAAGGSTQQPGSTVIRVAALNNPPTSPSVPGDCRGPPSRLSR